MKRFLLLAILALGMTGCSSFHRDWRKAAQLQPSGIEGRWEGTWLSKANGHGGKLRCILIQKTPQTYEARFHAKYKKILGFGYTAEFVGAATNGTFHFSGEADLGALAGGVYRYEGTVTPRKFFSLYHSKPDYGTFEMVRPKDR